MKVFIRADSSTQIGSGHVMRCLTLAGDLRRLGVEVLFVSRVLPGNLSEYIESKGFGVYRLDTDVDLNVYDYWDWLRENWLKDAQEVQKILLKEITDFSDINTVDEQSFVTGNKSQSENNITNISSNIVMKKFSNTDLLSQSETNLNLVVDSYSLDIMWEKYLRPYVNKILVLDDLANRPHDCDILLDQNYYLKMENRYRGLAPSTCQMLFGPKYALLRPEFHQAKRSLRRRDGKVRSILVFFGGSDPTNETVKALRAIKRLNRPDIAVDVVVGTANPHKEKVKKVCNQMSNTTYYCQVENMAELMATADLAIGAGGATTWERLYLELPTIAIAVAENQVETLEALSEVGVVRFLRNAGVIESSRLKAEIEDLVENLSEMIFNIRVFINRLDREHV